jgi:hypothetical protein
MEPRSPHNFTDSAEIEQNEKTVLQKKVMYLINRLDTETDLSQIREILELIQKCKEIESIYFN